MIPVLLATRMVVPDSKNGEVKSTAASLSALTLRDVSTMSNFLATSSPIRPFHFPFYRGKKQDRVHTTYMYTVGPNTMVGFIV